MRWVATGNQINKINAVTLKENVTSGTESRLHYNRHIPKVLTTEYSVCLTYTSHR